MLAPRAVCNIYASSIPRHAPGCDVGRTSRCSVGPMQTHRTDGSQGNSLRVDYFGRLGASPMPAPVKAPQLAILQKRVPSAVAGSCEPAVRVQPRGWHLVSRGDRPGATGSRRPARPGCAPRVAQGRMGGEALPGSSRETVPAAGRLVSFGASVARAAGPMDTVNCASPGVRGVVRLLVRTRPGSRQTARRPREPHRSGSGFARERPRPRGGA